MSLTAAFAASFATPATVTLALAGLILAVFYGVVVTWQLVNVDRIAPLVSDRGTAASDVPTMRFRGEAFEGR